MKFKTGLREKLIVLYVFFAIIPVLLLGVLSYRISYRSLWNNTTHSTKQIAVQLGRSIESLFQDTERLISLGNSQEVKSYILAEGNDYENAKRVLAQFQIYRETFPLNQNINNIYVVGTNGKQISERYGVRLMEIGEIGGMDLQELVALNGEALITAGPENAGTSVSEQYIYIGKALSLPALREPFGAVILEIKSDAIEAFCRDFDMGGSGYFTVFDPSGRVVFGPDYGTETEREGIFEQISPLAEGTFTGSLNGEKAFFVFNTEKRTGWKLVGQIPVDELMREASEIGRTTVASILLILLFAVPLYLVFSSRVILPLRRLKATMQMAALGDMGIRFKTETGDEIHDLGESFNRMIEQLDGMAKQSLRRQASLKNAELKLLKAQINPHFFYNTMDTILWQAKSGKTEEVVVTVDALSTFFRTSLSNGRDWVSVGDEINLIRNYLLIQKMRYEDVLTYEIKIDPGMLTYKMLKLTLQPIAENALYHGVKQRRSGGCIWVLGKRENDMLVFTVEDNGPGVTPERLDELRRDLQSEVDYTMADEHHGFGLKNVSSRIRLNYGAGSELTLYNREGGGMGVRIILSEEESDV